MWSTRGKQGFTLIELLVVIAIIALLMAILLPALGRVRRQGKAVVCQSNLRQWGKTLALYLEENQGCFPPSSVAGGTAISLFRGALYSFREPNEPVDSFHHFDTKDIACCPMAVKPDNAIPLSAWGHGSGGSTFRAWEITSPGPAFRGSYGINRHLFYRRYSDHGPPGGIDIFYLRGRANIPTLLDARQPLGRPRDHDFPPRFREELVRITDMWSFCIDRHNGHVNGLFLDWSVRKVGLKELWTLKWHAEFNTAGRWTKAGGVQPERWPEWMRHFKDY